METSGVFMHETIFFNLNFKEDFNNINLLSNKEFVNQLAQYMGECYGIATR